MVIITKPLIIVKSFTWALLLINTVLHFQHFDMRNNNAACIFQTCNDYKRMERKLH